ncbi:MAG TPA: CoA-binding protein [Paracoccaceae bacterium]|nr:CoA-binding protein [Paracoccaceae bacterium]
MTEELPDAPPDADLRAILARTKVIALVGASANPLRPSYFVGRYLAARGYRVIPVNPGLAGQALFGETVRARLSDIPPGDAVDMVDIFRRSEEAGRVADEARAALPALSCIWMQTGVRDPAAAARARTAGVDVVMNRCTKMEHQRLFDELRRAGINTGILSSRL